MTGILMDALIWIYADIAGAGEAKRAPGHEPLIEEIARQSFAQFQLAQFSKPGLGDIQDQQRAGNHRKDHELVQKLPKVLERESIVERLVPSIELDLAEGGQRDNRADRESEQEELVAAGRMYKSCEHHSQLRRELLAPRCSRRLAPGRFVATVIHLRRLPFLLVAP